MPDKRHPPAKATLSSCSCQAGKGKHINVNKLGGLFGSERVQNEKSPNFSNFRPEFCSEFSPKISRIFFCAIFPGKRRTQKIHQKSPPFFNAKSPGKVKEKIHKSLLESGPAKDCLRTGWMSKICLCVLGGHSF